MAITTDVNAQYLLSQIQKYQSSIQVTQSRIPLEGVQTETLQPTNFASTVTEAMGRALNQVNESQQASRAMVTRFESGEDVPLTDVVLSMQKSSLAFEATLQVRNKIMKAYEDIMNMPV
jgi:flagellar hook-basal body complex protein FliE